MRVGFVVKPETTGLVASSAIALRSAPSAKIFTRRRLTTSFIASPFPGRQTKNPLRRLLEIPHCCIGLGRDGLSVAPIDEDRGAPRAAGCFHVPPAVAHEEAGGEVDPPALCSRQQHPGSWLAAVAAVGVVVEADRDVVQGQGLP